MDSYTFSALGAVSAETSGFEARANRSATRFSASEKTTSPSSQQTASPSSEMTSFLFL